VESSLDTGGRAAFDKWHRGATVASRLWPRAAQGP
jgi:hypothetical protein